MKYFEDEEMANNFHNFNIEHAANSYIYCFNSSFKKFTMQLRIFFFLLISFSL